MLEFKTLLGLIMWFGLAIQVKCSRMITESANESLLSILLLITNSRITMLWEEKNGL